MPRRQCCTTVVGFKKRNKNTTLPRPPRPPSSTPSSSSSKTSSALHRASEALINAFKSLPLSQKSVKVKVKKLAATSFLSRSFSSSSRRFWRKARREEGIISEGESSGRKWRRSFRELLMEERDSKTTTLKNEDIMFIVNPITATLDEDIMMLNNVDPSMTTSSESWGESEFTFSSSSRSSSAEKDIVDEGNKEGATREKNTEEGVRRTVSHFIFEFTCHSFFNSSDM
ncbi:hypothetical protein RIF29_34278 [Crotalaria pallida]|uniref:Uncharacterized protein n=1 Tax=Crotalaria pallida TaxID=3830 RepID=A0AAN9EEI9_CROPI